MIIELKNEYSYQMSNQKVSNRLSCSFYHINNFEYRNFHNYFPNPLSKLSMNPKMDNLFWFKLTCKTFARLWYMYERHCEPIIEPHQKPIRTKLAVGVPVNMTILL